MAINLLPSEEKEKSKTEKQLREHTIVMTGPTHSEKTRSSVKRAGVLTFFKGAFSRPKKQVTDEKTVRVPEHKVNIEEHIVYQASPAVPEKKVIAYTKPAAKQATQLHPLPKDAGGFLARFMRRQPASPSEPVKPAHTDGNQFPKHTAVRSEQVPSSFGRDKHRNGDVIKVTTIGPDHAGRAHRSSIIARFLHWVHELFIRSPRAPKKDSRVTQLAAMPAPLAPSPTVHFRTAVVTPPTVAVAKPIPAPVRVVAPVIAPPPPPAPRPIIERPIVPITKAAAPQKPITPVVPPIPVVPPVEKKKSEHSPMQMTDAQPMAEPSNAPRASWWSRLQDWMKSLRHRGDTAKKPGVSSADASGLPFGSTWEVNLVPEESLEQEISISRVMILATFVVVAIGVVFGVWLWANWYFNSITTSINEVNNQIVISDIQIRSYEKMLGEIDIVRKQIENVSTLLDTHVYWSSFFSELEKTTSPDVYFTSMSADANGTVTLQAVGRNYDAAIKQLMVFENADAFVTTVSVSNIAFSSSPASAEGTSSTDAATGTVPASRVADTPVTFTASLTVTPEVFYFSPSL